MQEVSLYSRGCCIQYTLLLTHVSWVGSLSVFSINMSLHALCVQSVCFTLLPLYVWFSLWLFVSCYTFLYVCLYALMSLPLSACKSLCKEYSCSTGQTDAL